MRIVRRLLQLVVTLLTVFVLAVGVVALNAYREVPPDSGTVTLAATSLHAPVTIVRDSRGVPTITAANEDDAYFALGYVHAQDRLAQMEFMRRAGQGRLSEIVGKLGLSTDRFMRTLGVYRRAEADFAGLDPAVQRAFQRYADGVNAWLANRHRPLPLEFHILWFSPEPWKPVDSLVWQKLMGLQLSGNWDEELLRTALNAKLGSERADVLFAQPRAGDPATVTGVPAPLKATDAGPMNSKGPHVPFPETLQPDRLLRELLRGVTPTLASNVWAVAGSRTASGKPLLANDPHLGFQMPSLWYLAILKTPDITLTGATVPGVPLHILGHNGHVAWGLTTAEGDTEDLFLEHELGGGKAYETPTGPADFVTHAETIAVRFGKPVEITVRETRHGPVISDILGPGRVPDSLLAGDRVLALSATVLQPNDKTAGALYHMARASDVAAFREALRDFNAPEQNIMFADAQSIGYVAAGLVPVRKSGDGTLPAPGWNGEADWTGWVPFEQLPQVIDPPEGVIVNANNRISTSVTPFIAAHWPEAYRARRILSVLESAKGPLTADDMAALQTDTLSIAAQEILPLLVPNVQPRSDQEKALLQSVAAWDGTMTRDRVEPLVFAVWMDRLKGALIADDLGDLSDTYYGERVDVLRTLLSGDADRDVSWCDDVGTPQRETCADQIQAAWNAAIDWIAAREGRPASSWRWDDFHRAAFDHQVFAAFPGLDRLASRAIPTPGGEYTVNRGSYREIDRPRPLIHVHGPGFRGVYDLSDLEHSRFALAGGESGHLTSAHYDDLLIPWRDGQGFPLIPSDASASRLTLVPAP